jgi:hypothetical protein
MADLTSVGVTSGVPSSGTGTVGTINYLTQVGSPISNGSTVTPVTVAITGTASAVTSTMSALVVNLSPNSSVRTMTLSSNPTVILSSNPTVIPSSVYTVTLSSNPTVIASSDMAITSITSGSVSIISGANTATVKAGNTAASSADTSLVVQISPLSMNPNGQQPSSNSSPVVISSNQTVIPVYISSGLVTPSSVVSVAQSTTVGLTISSVIISTTTNATLVSSTPRSLYKVEVFNVSSTPAFLKMYNLASAPTVGSSLVVARYAAVPNGFISTTDVGDLYTTGLSYTFTTNLIDTDTTVIANSSTYIVNLHYR